MLVNARTPGDDGQSRNTNLLYTPDREAAGHVLEAAPGAVRRVRAVARRARAGSPSCGRSRTTSSPATSRTLFRAGGHPFESVICFESAFGPLVRDAVRDGAEVVVVSTNNRSYQRSANSEQHLALGQMRAAETGRPVLQASVSGISAVIDPDGSLHHETGLFESRIVTASVPTSTGETLYVRFGDWVVLLSAIAMLVVTVRGDPSPGATGSRRQQLDRGDEPDHHDQRRATRARGGGGRRWRRAARRRPSRPR